MSIFGLSLWMVLAAAGTALVLWVSIRRSLRLRATRRVAAETPAGEATPTEAEAPAPETLASTAGSPARTGSRLAQAGLGRRRAEAPPPRLEALVAAQADLAARVEALSAGQSAPEERLQGMAAQLLGLVRDKNATLETALAGLDQLRERMRAIEQMGEPAEARALLERLEGRLDEIRSSQAAGAAALEARIAGLEAPSGNAVAELADRLTQIHTQKDAVAETVLARIATLEQGLAARDPAPALDRLASRIDETRAALEARVTALEASNPLAEISEQFARLHARKDAAVEAVLARLQPLETRLGELSLRVEARDPAAGIARLEADLEDRVAALKAAHAAAEAALAARVSLLETPEKNPFTEISAQLTRLYAQKDATVETVFARLQPLEARLADLDRRLAGQDPRALLDRFAERLEAVQGRLAQIEAEDSPFADISDQLTRLYAQKDAAVEAVLTRLQPLEARLADFDRRLAGADPAALLDRFAERLEAVRGALEGRIAQLEAPGENPFADISEQLTRLYAQKDATVETVFARLQPLEARLTEIDRRLAGQDPSVALARFAERLEAVRGTLEGRLTALETEENPFTEISDQLARLYAQKDATVETVFARLQPLEARLVELDQRLAGADPAALLDRFAERLEGVRGALEGRIAQLEAPGENPFADISEQLTRLYAQKDATVETVFARLQPLEAQLADLDRRLAGQDPAGVLDRFAERLEAVRSTLDTRIAQLEAPEENPFADISEQLTRLYAQKDATVETVFARLQPLEAQLADLDRRLTGQDPAGVLDRFAERLETVQGRVAQLEAAENPFADISEQLTRLYAQKDATVETVFARLQPLEAQLADLDRRLAGQDPAGVLDRFAERLEAVQGRLAQLEAGEGTFTEISDQLTRLYAQKDATVETVFARLQPLEARLTELDQRLTGADPAALLDRFADRLEGVRGALEGRIAQLEAPEENPFADISEQLTRLYAQKDATVETVFARLQPLEARLAELDHRLAGADPAGILDRFAERLEAVRSTLDTRLAALELPGENPFAEISEQLTRLYAQKDATVETVFARLQPLEARLTDFDRRLAGQDPAGVLDRFAERLETVQGRVAQLEAVENPFAEISDQLTRLYAQKDATVETVFARLQPLEAKLAELEAGLGALRPLAESLAAADPRAEIDGLTARIEALNWAQGEVAAGLAALKAAAEAEAAAEAAGLTPVAGLADQLTRLYAQKDAGLAQVLERLAPLEARLSGLEARPWDPAGEEARDEARAQAQAIAAQMIAARTASDQVAAQTGLFADRLALLEASLPRLSAAQATLMQALEARTLAMAAPAIAAAIAPGMTLGLQGFPAAPLSVPPGGAIPPTAPAAGAQPAGQEPGAAASPSPAAGPVPGTATPGQDDIWTMPRLISLHQR